MRDVSSDVCSSNVRTNRALEAEVCAADTIEHLLRRLVLEDLPINYRHVAAARFDIALLDMHVLHRERGAARGDDDPVLDARDCPALRLGEIDRKSVV